MIVLFIVSPFTTANNDSNIIFPKKMSNYSNIFSFDPLRGKVKESWQTMKSNNEIKLFVYSKFDSKGCLLEIKSLDTLTGMAFRLVKKGSFLSITNDNKNITKLFDLDDDCTILSRHGTQITFKYINGLLSEVKDGEAIGTSYIYDNHNLLRENNCKIGYCGGIKKTNFTYSFNALNLTEVLTIYTPTDRKGVTATREHKKCNIFDSNNNPIQCALTVSYSDGSEEKNTIIYKTTYYE
ncbi:hypothetical protein A3Q29_06335 [Providencia stuartii]|uniref:YnfC family lipoprotein n=1 Tax=Providencia stuartii TaxID=588 RepID=A0A1S1HMP6_PROST|nr:hypothetical protein A3Q29_06335 [Providencia stuartii]